MQNIVFDKDNQTFTLNTKNTKYVFRIINGKYLAHLFYGNRNGVYKTDFNYGYKAFSASVENDDGNICLNEMPAEIPFFGSGEFAGDALKLCGSNGNSITLAYYKKHKIFKGRKAIPNLPFAKDDDNTDTLSVTLVDEIKNCEITLYYTIFYERDVISRYLSIKNFGNDDVYIDRAKSLCLDMDSGDYDCIYLVGSHYNERKIVRNEIDYGIKSLYSARGISSHNINPYFSVCKKDADYCSGEVYSFNYCYSGCFNNTVEKTYDGKIRIMVGANEDYEVPLLKKGETYFTAEAVMTYSDKGIGGTARNFHDFVRSNIITSKNLCNHPIVLNTWEAFIFDIDEEKLLKIASEAASIGIEMLVVDDGWFSSRNDDKSGLGDWWINKNKFSSGLVEFSKKIKNYGLKLGIWIEPEMVNPNSELYKKHKEWCLNSYGRPLSLSRNQLVLDMGNNEVIEYLKKSFSEVFRDVEFSYVKWDMNRSLSMVGKNYAEGGYEGNLYREYVEGVYSLLDWFTITFPDVMIESCSGGGGRYDLGMMNYSAQIWTSDNTYPTDRLRIQSGSLIAYPSCMMSSHVSNPSNVCEDEDELDYRFKTACSGVLGYEMDLLKVDSKTKHLIKQQIEFYKKIKETVLYGNFYPVELGENNYIYYYLNEKNGDIVLFVSGTKGEKVKVRITEATTGDSYINIFTNNVYDGSMLKNGFDIVLNKKIEIFAYKKVDKNDL